MARRGQSETLSVDTSTTLRREILGGHRAPGQRLRPIEIGHELGVSATVVREALTRLAGQHLVEIEPNQGFRVVSLGRRELEDLTITRKLVEGGALRLAMERGSLDWEAGVVAVHHRLAATPQRDPEEPNRTGEEWATLHARFHRALLEACNIPVLLDVCASLWDAAEIYRRWSAPAAGRRRDVAAEHKELMSSALERDPDRAVALLEAHIQRTTDILLKSGWISDEIDQPNRHAPPTEPQK